MKDDDTRDWALNDRPAKILISMMPVVQISILAALLWM